MSFARPLLLLGVMACVSACAARKNECVRAYLDDGSNHPRIFSECLKVAESQDDPWAYGIVARYYKSEDRSLDAGIKQDKNLAAHYEQRSLDLYFKRAESGSKFDQYVIGEKYLEGRTGLPKDPTQARIWLERAATFEEGAKLSDEDQRGLSEALSKLQLLYTSEGRQFGFEVDDTKAFEYALKDAKLFSYAASAHRNLAYYYMNGLGTQRDDIKAYAHALRGRNLKMDSRDYLDILKARMNDAQIQAAEKYSRQWRSEY